MTDVLSYIRYFQQLANEHVDVRDFYIMDINEPLQAFKNGIRFPALILNAVNGRVFASNSDNTLDEISGGFTLLKNVPSVDDFPAEMDALEEMKIIGADIIGRMWYDKNKCELRTSKAILGFDINTVKYNMEGPIFDNCFGFTFTFKMLTSVDFSYDALKWSSGKMLDKPVVY